MNFHLNQSQRIIAFTGLAFASVALIAWQNEPKYQLADSVYYRDTVPAQAKSKGYARDLDNELGKLDEAIRNLRDLNSDNSEHIIGRLNKELGEIDLDALQLQIESSIIQLDPQLINRSLDEALRVIDETGIKTLKELSLDGTQALKELRISIPDQVDLHAIEQEIKESLGAIEPGTSEMRAALRSAGAELEKELADIKKLNSTEIGKVLSEARIALKAAKEEMATQDHELKTEMDKAGSQIEKARAKIKKYQEMIYTMEGDLLLDTKGDYKIQFLEGSLYIDNKKQPDNVSTKYKKFFDEDITIKKEKGHFAITGNDAVED